jgi:hypothetical protein
VDVPLGNFNFNDTSVELQLSPSAPLAPGYYQAYLGGDLNSNDISLADLNGIPLGTNAQHPNGQNVTLSFQVSGVEGTRGMNAPADDTPATAHDFGNISAGGPVQVAGTIGDDPTDPIPFDSADVDLYHFRITGPGRYAFAAEVFAHRIGSPLNAGVSLFVLDPGSGQLRLLAGNDDTMNPIKAADHRSEPLFSDPALFTGLEAGDYYVAVSAHGNVPDPDRGWLPGTNGIFDPNISHSGTAGVTLGPYVLNLRAVADNVAPQVTAVTPQPGEVLTAPPTELTVTFSKAVDLQNLAFQAFATTQQGSLTAVYLRGPNGVLYYPRLESFDPSGGQATFLMLDRLPAGSYQLHLSGPEGLTDFAGNELVGNSPDGDYVSSFTVAAGGANGSASASSAQDMGVLFPHEMEGNGVPVTWPAITNPADTCSFQVLQTQSYFFLLGGRTLSPGLQLTLTDAQGNPVSATVQADGVSLQAFLNAGSYEIRMTGGTPAGDAGDNYTLRIVLGGSAENPPPLTLGPAPVLSLRLTSPLVSTTPPPPVPVPAPAAGNPSAPPSGGPPALPSTNPSPAPAAAAPEVPPSVPSVPTTTPSSSGETNSFRGTNPLPTAAPSPVPSLSVPTPTPTGTVVVTMPAPEDSPAGSPRSPGVRPADFPSGGTPLPTSSPSPPPGSIPSPVAAPSFDPGTPPTAPARAVRLTEPTIPVPAGLLVALGAEPIGSATRPNPPASGAALTPGLLSPSFPATSLLVPVAHGDRRAEGGGSTAETRAVPSVTTRAFPSLGWFGTGVARLVQSLAVLTHRLEFLRPWLSPGGVNSVRNTRLSPKVADFNEPNAAIAEVRFEENRPVAGASRLALDWTVLSGLILFMGVERLLRQPARSLCSRRGVLGRLGALRRRPEPQEDP